MGIPQHGRASSGSSSAPGSTMRRGGGRKRLREHRRGQQAAKGRDGYIVLSDGVVELLAVWWLNGRQRMDGGVAV